MPTTPLLLLRAAGVAQGSGSAGTQTIGTVSLKHIYEIAKIKQQDLKAVGEEQVS
jgi:large subunit ribosomal protein L11